MNRKLFPVLVMLFIGFISWTNVNAVIKIKENSWEFYHPHGGNPEDVKNGNHKLKKICYLLTILVIIK